MKPVEKLFTGVKAAFKDRRKAATSITLSLSFLIFLALSTAVNYSFQMFSSGIQYWLPAVELTVRGFYLNGGWTELILNCLYALSVGVILTNTYTQFRAAGLKIGNLSGIAPGVLVAGCAGCGVGILSILGISGVVAFLPFGGFGLKIGGIVLILYFIARIGNPEVCSIE
jgi:hypothetical protein